MVNPFFKNTGPHLLSSLLDTLHLKVTYADEHINDIKDYTDLAKPEFKGPLGA